MPGVHTSQIADFLVDTLDKFHDKGNFQTYLTENNYFFLSEVFGKEDMKVQSGSQITWHHVFGDTGAFRHTNLMEPRGTRNIVDLLSASTVPWRYGDTEAYYENHRVSMNEGAEQKVDYVKVQYYGAIKSMCDGIESRAFLAPDTQGSTEKTPWGLPYWIRKADTGVTTNGFHGQTIIFGDATTSTTIAGISTATQPKAKNWAGIRGATWYDTAWTIKEGLIKTNIRAPQSLEEYMSKRSKKLRCLMSDSDYLAHCKLVTSGNDDRNGDVNPFGNNITMHGLRIDHMSRLEGVTDSPIYIVDLAKFKPVIHADWWMKRGNPFELQDPRNVMVVPWDCQYNYLAEDLRHSGFVVHTAR